MYSYKSPSSTAPHSGQCCSCLRTYAFIYFRFPLRTFPRCGGVTSLPDSDDSICCCVHADLRSAGGDVVEHKAWAEIYSITYPAGVSLRPSRSLRDLLWDLKGFSPHITVGSVPEGINSCFYDSQRGTVVRGDWQAGKKL